MPYQQLLHLPQYHLPANQLMTMPLAFLAFILGTFFYFRHRKQHKLKDSDCHARGQLPYEHNSDIYFDQLQYAEADSSHQYAEADPTHAVPAELGQSYKDQPILAELSSNPSLASQPISHLAHRAPEISIISSPNILSQADPLHSGHSISPSTQPPHLSC